MDVSVTWCKGNLSTRMAHSKLNIKYGWHMIHTASSLGSTKNLKWLRQQENISQVLYDKNFSTLTVKTNSDTVKCSSRRSKQASVTSEFGSTLSALAGHVTSVRTEQHTDSRQLSRSCHCTARPAGSVCRRHGWVKCGVDQMPSHVRCRAGICPGPGEGYWLAQSLDWEDRGPGTSPAVQGST